MEPKDYSLQLSKIQKSTQELNMLAHNFKEIGNDFISDKLIRIASQIDTQALEIQHFSKIT